MRPQIKTPHHPTPRRVTNRGTSVYLTVRRKPFQRERERRRLSCLRLSAGHHSVRPGCAHGRAGRPAAKLEFKAYPDMLRRRSWEGVLERNRHSKSSQGWRFRVSTVDQTAMFVNEEDRGNLSLESRHASHWVNSWEAALDFLNQFENRGGFSMIATAATGKYRRQLRERHREPRHLADTLVQSLAAICPRRHTLR